jgi:hypothetical protein
MTMPIPNKRVQNRTPYKYKLQTWEEMYLANLSVPQIVKLLGVPRTPVDRYLRNLGIMRSMKEAGRLYRKDNTAHWRTTRNRAVNVWKESYGNIPVGYHIHHKDGDYTNNTIDNLECLSASQHQLLHLQSKLKCKYGHILDADNIYYEKIKYGRVTRRCKICILARQRTYKETRGEK